MNHKGKPQNAETTTEESSSRTPNARRDFLKQGAGATGALLSLSILGATRAEAATETPAPSKAAPPVAPPVEPQTLQLSLKEHKALAKIGGSEIVPITGDTLIVARTDANAFVACSAICPHKGCKVEYEHEAREFFCPCHDSRFALNGKVLRGPAKTSLKNYATDLAAVISLQTPPLQTPPLAPKKSS